MRENVCVLSSWVALVFYTDFPLAVPLCYSVFSVSELIAIPHLWHMSKEKASKADCHVASLLPWPVDLRVSFFPFHTKKFIKKVVQPECIKRLQPAEALVL